MMISVILLTCDSHKLKGFCVRHCFQSILNQSFEDYEIVLVDNGNDTAFDLRSRLSSMSEKLPSNKITWLKTPETINRGAARNYGAQNASGEILVFIDEDVILTDMDSFATIHQYALWEVWGCGATRLWTYGDWFVVNNEEILNRIKLKENEFVHANAGEPEENIRGTIDIDVERRSFVGHFGFCRKDVFMSVGGFVDLHPANSFDDDLLNIKLFQSSGRPKLLHDITIVHVNHPIHGSRTNDYSYYFMNIVEQGVFSFDSEALVFGREIKLLQELRPVHQNEFLLEAFTTYKRKLPLNYPELSAEEIEFWRTNVALELDEFCRLVYNLLQKSTVDEFISCNPVDFDNVGPVIESLLECDILLATADGKLITRGQFLQRKPGISFSKQVYKFEPNLNLNQFPCSADSLDRRMNFLKHRYPFAEFLRVGIIGDDDLLSLRMQDELWMYPITIEKDDRLVQIIKGLKKGKVCELDLLHYREPAFLKSIDAVPRVHTFITDPPYTLHGILLFVWVGLCLLEKDNTKKEFYVIVNPMLIGRPFEKLIGILAEAGISLSGVVENISTYPLPEHYSETNRAIDFTKKYGLASPIMSSTSNLYIFTTSNPKLELMGSYLNADLVYEHYQL